MTDNSGPTSVDTETPKSGTLADPNLPTGSMVPQPNGGALRKGNPGNRGGTGRPPKEVQSRSRLLYERVLDQLERKIEEAEAESKTLELSDLVSVGGMAGRYAGLGDDVQHTISIGSLHLAALQAPKPISVSARLAAVERAQAIELQQDSPDSAEGQ